MIGEQASPLILIVTVCYQDLPNVVRTCRSIADQLGELSVEHILVDGGSSDGTQDWYKSNAPLIRNTMVSEPDSGIFDAMNKGIDLARGQYIGFLNAGAMFSDSLALERVTAYLNENFPEWTHSRADVVDGSGNRVRNSVGRVPYSKIQHALGLATVCHQTVFMKKSVLRHLGGFDTTFGTAANYHLLLKAGSIKTPLTRTDLDVFYESGGVSDTDVYRQLVRRHRARVAVYELHGLVAASDRVWTFGQVLLIRLEKRVKRALRKLGLKRFLGRVVA